MTTTTDSLPAADRFADDCIARELTDEQALDECRLSGITLPEGEHWQYYLDAARERAVTATTDILDELAGSWVSDGERLRSRDGYEVANYFGPLDATYPTREAAIAAIRAAYRGPDDYGVGLRLSDLDPVMQSDMPGAPGGPLPMMTGVEFLAGTDR